MADDMADDFERVFDGAPSDRRTFLRRLVIGTVFAVPVVSSFSMAGISAAYAGSGHGSNSNQVRNPNQISNPNQPCAPIHNPNQTDGPIRNPNQTGREGHHGGGIKNPNQ